MMFSKLELENREDTSNKRNSDEHAAARLSRSYRITAHNASKEIPIFV